MLTVSEHAQDAVPEGNEDQAWQLQCALLDGVLAMKDMPYLTPHVETSMVVAVEQPTRRAIDWISRGAEVE